MIIDAHQHFWYYEPVTHEWIDDKMAVIRRNFLPQDLQKIYVQHDVVGCVAVQADQTLRETDFLIQLGEEFDFIKGIVGWVDLRAANIDEVLSAYSQNDKVKGFRHIVQGETDHNFLLRPNFLHGISLLEKFSFTYDLLVFPHQLGATLEFVKRFPNQKFVIDHLAKPYIKDGFYDGWAALMNAIAKHENVYCKLSGMITEADYQHWTSDQIQPYMELVLNAFGPNRLMFGSDWPVCLVAGDYLQVKKLVEDFITSLSTTEQSDIMGKNANHFYNLVLL